MKKLPRYKTTYVVSEKLNGWDIRDKLYFNTFEELKTYLIDNTNELFGWINWINKDDFKGYRELPNFIDVETVRDINIILDDYTYSWWFMTVDIIAVEQENE